MTTRNAIPTLPDRLRELRDRAGLTQAALAGLVGTSQSALGSIEAGHRAPSLELSIRIAKALGVSLDTLTTPAGSEVWPARC